MPPTTNRLALACAATILLRLAIAVVHGGAHDALQVPLAAWQQTFVVVVIVILPVVCVPLFWTRWRAAAAGVAAVSLAAGLLFGLYFHFLLENPDHVAHVAAGPARGRFISTAALLVLAESVATLLCAWLWRLTGASAKLAR